MVNIVSDSGGGSNRKLDKELNLSLVPFYLEIDGEQFIDDENFDLHDFLDKMKNSNGRARSAAPSPNSFIEKLKEKVDNFIITITSKESGAYQNALIAKDMVKDKIKKIHVFDSKSAVSGETLVAIKIRELEKLNKSFEEIVEKITSFIEKMETYFVLDDFTNLIDNGRVRKIAGKIVEFLNIKAIARGNDGNIELCGQKRGMAKAVDKLIEYILNKANYENNDTCVIAHVYNEKMALKVKEEVEKRGKFKRIEVIEAYGLGSMYANMGGIVVSF